MQLGMGLGVLMGLVLAGAGPAGEVIDPSKARVEEDSKLLWYDLRLLDVEGKGWSDTKAFYDRLPAKAEGLVRPPVWGLSRQSAGLCVRFVTDATTLTIRWKLTGETLALPHMPATGVSGLDLYVRLADTGRWHWLGTGRPSTRTNRNVLASGLPEGKREYLLYLPLYNGVSSVEIGLSRGTTLAKGPARPKERQKPIVFYGTSITQGGCASRPGMVHTAILGRKLECPVINLGFSGNGTMDPEMAQLLGEIDAAVYVIDCLPNMIGQQVEERTEPLVQTLRKARPTTPIVLVEDRSYANAVLLPVPRERNRTSRAALKKVFEKLTAAGIKDLYYLAGEHLLGEDGEDTVDGSHPTDLGFVRQAEAFQKVLEPLLPKLPGK
jgi:GDSL-like Lipase/Acylhydrolase family/N-terminus of Esterase_SGNH_hydro-type